MTTEAMLKHEADVRMTISCTKCMTTYVACHHERAAGSAECPTCGTAFSWGGLVGWTELSSGEAPE